MTQISFEDNYIGNSYKRSAKERRDGRSQNLDRFVRSRCTVRRHQLTLNPETPSENVDRIVNQPLYSSNRERYRDMLAAALSLTRPEPSWERPWPVRSRPRPCIHAPSVILDLPNIRNDFCSNLMDWSASDYLTVAFPRSVYLWHAPRNQTVRFPSSGPSCVKWDPNGTALFIASKSGLFKLTDVFTQQDTSTSQSLRCHDRCFICSCSFHPTAPLLITGCSKGAVSRFNINKALHHIDTVHDNSSAITSLSFSSDGMYFALTSMSSTVAVYNALLFQPVFIVKLGGPTRALSWHPWSRSCLVVGDCLGFMAVYDILSSKDPIKPEASYTSLYNSAILSLNFNPLSAELVVSHRIFNGSSDDGTVPNAAETQLNVLASFDRVVDRMIGHTGRVPFLAWSPDGTKLASSGSDETARIWDFLQHTSKKRTQKPKMNYADAALEVGNRMGQALR